jgi:hypothetical protein
MKKTINANNTKNRIVGLLEKYEENDLFYDRAGYLESSRLNIRDELIA